MWTLGIGVLSIVPIISCVFVDVFLDYDASQNNAYMKGAIALLSVKTIIAPNSNKTSTIGNNQYRLRIFRNSQNSVIID
jgi:hypothetical protein